MDPPALLSCPRSRLASALRAFRPCLRLLTRACARARISGSAFLPDHSGFRLKGRPFSLTFLPDCRLPGCLPPLALPLVFSPALAFDSALGPSVRFVRPTRPTVASPVPPSNQTVAFALIQPSGIAFELSNRLSTRSSVEKDIRSERSVHASANSVISVQCEAVILGCGDNRTGFKHRRARGNLWRCTADCSTKLFGDLFFHKRGTRRRMTTAREIGIACRRRMERLAERQNLQMKG